MATTTHATHLEAGRRVCSRIVVGIDGSQQALEAARQAALLQEVDGALTLLSAWDIAPVTGGTGTGIPCYLDDGLQRATAEKALRAAGEYIAPYTDAGAKLVRGTPVGRLLEEIGRAEDTLVAVGSSGSGRLRGIVEGTVATEMVHRAPCSVLVARQADHDFPHRVVVGVDGSLGSAAAYATARYLAERFGAELHALVARGGKGVNERLVRKITDGDHDDRGQAPAEALAQEAKSADLVVVGSRGLHGLRPLGSVCERIAHTASCSALVVSRTHLAGRGRRARPLGARHGRDQTRDRRPEEEPMTELLAPQPPRSRTTDTAPARPASNREPYRRVLVVVDEPCTAPELCASVRGHVGSEPVDAFVIAPAHGSVATQWYVDEDAARADATHRLQACVTCLAGDGIRAEGRLSDPDPVRAIADALETFPADEILFITGPQRRSTWLRKNAFDRARRRFPQPIEHIVMPRARPGAEHVAPTTAGGAWREA